MTQLTQDMVVSKWCSIKPDGDSDESKTIKVELTIPKGTSVLDMAHAILKPEVIRVQNAQRPKWDKVVDKTTVKVTFKRPVAEVDPMTALLNEAQAAGVDTTDTDALTVFIMAKLTK